MATRLEGLRAEFQEKSAQAREILNKADRTGEETTKALDLTQRVKALKPEIENEIALEQFKAEESTRTAWAETAVPTVPFGTKSVGVLEGSERAGSTRFKMDDMNGRFDEVGAGTIGEKAWEAIQTKEYAQAFNTLIRRGEKAVSPMQWKVLQLGDDSQGGTFAPADFIAMIIGRKPAPTMLRSYFTSLTTGRQKLSMPRVQYSADDLYSTGFRVTNTGENPSSDTVANVDDSNLTGNVSIDINTFMMTAPVTNDMVEDSAFPILPWLQGKLQETYDLFVENKSLNGVGIIEPDGIMNGIGGTNRVASVLSGAAGALAYDGYIDTYTALPPQYDAGAVWVMNKASGYRATLKIKDSQNRPLMSMGTTDSGLAGERTKVIEGMPVIISQFMPNVSSTTYPVLFGDLKGYYHVDRIGLSIQVLREIQARRNRVELCARFRLGGATIEPWKMRAMKSNNS